MKMRKTYNVLVNGLLVGRIESEQWERRHAKDPRNLSLEDWYAEAANRLGISMGRFGTAEEFANIATFLASDAGSYINGTAKMLMVDSAQLWIFLAAYANFLCLTQLMRIEL